MSEDFERICERAEELVEEVLADAKPASAADLGLDVRCGHRLYVGPDYIAIAVHNDRTLQYYGGFEYVDVLYRMELGGYAFYSTEDDRVAEHHAQFKPD